MREEVTVESSATVHAKAEKQRMRVAVTIFVYLYGCFMAVYLSRYIRGRCKSDALPNTVITALDSCLMRQYVLEDSACRIALFTAIKVGCPITPMKQSVVAKHASAILDLVFNRNFAFTAIITSPFNRLVTGRVIIVTIIKVTVTARASVVLEERRILPLRSVISSLLEGALSIPSTPDNSNPR